MPCAVLGVLLYPFGLDRPIWMLMGAANEHVLSAAQWIESFPRASLTMPASNAGFALLVVALLIFTIPLGRARLIGLGLPCSVDLQCLRPSRRI